MNSNKIVSYIYALIACILGTYFCIISILYYNLVIVNYNSYDGNTTGLIKTFECYNKNTCYSDIEYTVNDVKYLINIDVPNNLKVNDTITLKYMNDKPNFPYYLKIENNQYISASIIIFFLVFTIILLWGLLFLNMIFKDNYYNKYLYILYALIATSLSSYLCYLSINKNYLNDLNRYDIYDNYTIGIIKENTECIKYGNDTGNLNSDGNYGNGCISNIEYMIDNKNYNVETLTFDYKVGENVTIYYNSEFPTEITVYDKTINKRIKIIIISIIILILLWISLFYCIPIIFQ
jgi:hypothetical protein